MENECLNKFNPEGSILRKQQHIMLYMLNCIDDICKKHNIRYWLSSGTLLGAVRHKGYIPWDDDLDIEMLQKDYDKLLYVINEEGLPEGLVLQTKKTDENYIYSFAKIRHKYSRIVEPSKRSMKSGYDGIFIDIFPLRKTNGHVSNLSYHIGRAYYKVMERSSKYRLPIICERIIDVFTAKIIFPVLHCFALTLHKKDEYGHVLGIPFRYYPRNISDIFPLREIEFENGKYPCPSNTHAYLTKLYGDYMRLPDFTTINPHVSTIEIFD